METCDVEAYPRCFGQLISCGYLWGAGPPESEIEPLEVQVAKAREWAEANRLQEPRPIERMSEQEKEWRRTTSRPSRSSPG